MQQQKMRKNKWEFYSKTQLSTILTSTDETLLWNQSRIWIHPAKKNLIEKIKILEQVLNQTNKEYSALIQKQNFLMNIFHGKKKLELMNSEVGYPHQHEHVKTKIKGHRKNASTVNDRNITQAFMPNNQQKFSKQATTRGQKTSKFCLTKSPSPINNEEMKKPVENKFQKQTYQFTTSYLKRNGSRQIINKRKINNKCLNRYEMKFESIEQIWNNQSRENIQIYNKPTKTTKRI